MKYPRLVANREAIAHNAETIVRMCHDSGVEVAGVVKVVCGEPEIAKLYADIGMDMIADSRMDNVKKLRAAGIKVPLMLLRIPMMSELEDLVRYVDVTLISELETAKSLGKKALEFGKKQKIVYMVDIGDLREGVWHEEAVDEIVEASKVNGIELYGIGTNLGCYGGVIPDADNMNSLSEIADRIRSRGVDFKVISGGNTAALYLLENETLPKSINSFRLGESAILGTDVTNSRVFPFLRQDTFTLYAEIVELKTKPSVPVGRIGKDAMGRTPVFEDLGDRTRAILAIGEQDVNPEGMLPLLEGLKVMHASSDHTVIDVTDFNGTLKVGDVLDFRLSYGALLRASTSPYVSKIWG